MNNTVLDCIMTCVFNSSMNWEVCYLLNVHASIFQSSYEKWNWHPYMQNLLRLLCPTLYLSLSKSILPLQNDMNDPLTFIAFLTIVSRLLYYLFIVYFPVTSRFTFYMISLLNFYKRTISYIIWYCMQHIPKHKYLLYT